MIVGSVHPGGDAILPLRVRGPKGSTAEFQTVVDTGFNDCLVLSAPAIGSLGLPFREEGRWMLADGSEAAARIYSAEVEWFGRWRRILVVEMDGGSLLGMTMLRGCHLGVEVIDGGRVDIRALQA